jgi:hypothetical protein
MSYKRTGTGIVQAERKEHENATKDEEKKGFLLYIAVKSVDTYLHLCSDAPA